MCRVTVLQGLIMQHVAALATTFHVMIIQCQVSLLVLLSVLKAASVPMDFSGSETDVWLLRSAPHCLKVLATLYLSIPLPYIPLKARNQISD